jgi:hypothetical protein
MMSVGNWWWILFVIALLAQGAWIYRGDPANRLWYGGASVLLWILLFLLGLGVFGSPIGGGGRTIQ